LTSDKTVENKRLPGIDSFKMANFQLRKPKTWKIAVLNQSKPAKRSFGKLDIPSEHETRRGLPLTKSTTVTKSSPAHE